MAENIWRAGLSIREGWEEEEEEVEDVKEVEEEEEEEEEEGWRGWIEDFVGGSPPSPT